MQAKQYLQSVSDETLENHRHFMTECAETLLRAAQALGECVNSGGKVLICGNGGSAADAQHMAAEMVGRMLIDRRPLPAIALTTDSSNLTAIGNDFGFDVVFQKQVQAFAKPGDLLIAISTSGNSKNVVLAAEEAKRLGCKVISLTGGAGGKLREISDFSLNVSKGRNSSRIQETHIFAVHNLVDLVDRFFLK